MIFRVVKQELQVTGRVAAWPLLSVVLLLLAGCSNETKMNELREYVEAVVSRPPGQIDPPPQFVSYFALNTLTMVGTIGRGNQLWALIRVETGNVNRVTNGNYLGKNFGRIVTVSQTQVELIEIVPTGDGGWIERPQTIMMAQ